MSYVLIHVDPIYAKISASSSTTILISVSSWYQCIEEKNRSWLSKPDYWVCYYGMFRFMNCFGITGFKCESNLNTIDPWLGQSTPLNESFYVTILFICPHIWHSVDQGPSAFYCVFIRLRYIHAFLLMASNSIYGRIKRKKYSYVADVICIMFRSSNIQRSLNIKWVILDRIPYESIKLRYRHHDLYFQYVM